MSCAWSAAGKEHHGMNSKTAFWYYLSLVGLLGLVILIIVWNAWLAPWETQVIPRPIEFAIFLLPLAFLTKGLVAGSTKTHAYASFTSLFYVSFGFWYLFTPLERMYGASMLLFSFMLYLGSFMYARQTMVKIPKQS